MSTATYTFRPVSESDLPRLRCWLSEPHVREWRGDPACGLKTMIDHFTDETIDLFIVSLHDEPLGYIQSWSPHAEVNHPCCDQPRGTRGIDQFIGERDFVNRGHGSAFIRAFVAKLFEAGAPRAITDPNPRNIRAIKAYEKAGFRPLGYRKTISGDALLMNSDAGNF